MKLSRRTIAFSVALFLLSIHLSFAQDSKSDKEHKRYDSIQKTTASGPSGSDELFVNGTGYDYDLYLFRDDRTTGRSSFGVNITRYYSELMNFDSDGFLTNASELVENDLLPAKARITLRVWDVDHNSTYDKEGDGIPDPEVDYVYVNGNLILDESGHPWKLESGDNTWSVISIEIPIEWLKFPSSLGSSTSKPSMENTIEIDIDQKNAGWAIECDWISIYIPSPLRPIILIHGFMGGPSTWTTFKGFLDADGIPNHLPEKGFMSPYGAIAANAQNISTEIDNVLNMFGVDKLNIVAHSKGGIDSRMYLRSFGGDKVEKLVQLATPNHGSSLANKIYWLTSVRGPAAKQMTTWWMEKNFNYFFTTSKPVQLIGPRYTEQDVIPIYILAGVSNNRSKWGLVPPHDGVVSVFSATLPWNTPETETISATRINNGEFGHDHSGMHDNQDVYTRTLELLSSTSTSGTSNHKMIATNYSGITSASDEADSIQTVYTNSCSLAPGEKATIDLSLETSSITRFFAGGISDDFSFSLLDPSSNVIDEDYTGFYANSDELGNFMEYTIDDIEAGNWTLEIEAGSDSANLIVQVDMISNKTLNVVLEKETYSVSESFLVTAEFMDGTQAVTGANVFARILEPSSTEEDTLVLYDDGTNNDVTANDGVYSNQYAGTSSAGLMDIIAEGKKESTDRVSIAHVAIAPNSASFSDVFSESTSDTNSNALYDILEINVGLTVNTAGDYSVSGMLVDANDSVITSAYYSTLGASSLSTGSQTVSLQFDGKDIRNNGEAGPYYLANLILTDLSNDYVQVDYEEKPYSTSSYDNDVFERSTFMLTSNSDDTAIDDDDDGKFEELNVDIEVDVAVAGYYYFNAQLTDTLNNGIAWSVSSGTLTEGVNTLSFSFEGYKINESGISGNMIVTNLSIFNEYTGVFENFFNVHKTGIYDYTQFVGNDISGTVIDSVTSNPVPNATVVLGGTAVSVAYTDENGSFRFGGLEEGTYTVRAEIDTFSTETMTLTIPPDTIITLGLSVPLLNLDPDSLFIAREVGDSTFTDTIIISNDGSLALSWSSYFISDTSETGQDTLSNGWATIYPAQGDSLLDSSRVMEIHFNIDTLGTGIYSDSLIILSNDPSMPMKVVPVQLTVWLPDSLPVFSGLPEEITFAADMTDTLLVWDYVSDYETPDSLLSFNFSCNPDSLALVYNDESGELFISAKNASFSGNVYLYLEVEDERGQKAQDSVLVIVTPVTSVGGELELPTDFVLYQNYPNPFNPTTIIKFGVPNASQVKIVIYNILGQRVRELVNKNYAAGYYSITLDASKLPSGVYIYGIKAGDFSDFKKMVLIK